MLPQDCILDIPEFLGQIDIIDLRVLKSFDRLPQIVQFLLAIAPEIINRLALIDQPPADKDRLQQPADREIRQVLRFQVCSGSKISYGS